jgi:hypothetical protein
MKIENSITNGGIQCPWKQNIQLLPKDLVYPTTTTTNQKTMLNELIVKDSNYIRRHNIQIGEKLFIENVYLGKIIKIQNTSATTSSSSTNTSSSTTIAFDRKIKLLQIRNKTLSFERSCHSLFGLNDFNRLKEQSALVETLAMKLKVMKIKEPIKIKAPIILPKSKAIHRSRNFLQKGIKFNRLTRRKFLINESTKNVYLWLNESMTKLHWCKGSQINLMKSNHDNTFVQVFPRLFTVRMESSRILKLDVFKKSIKTNTAADHSSDVIVSLQLELDDVDKISQTYKCLDELMNKNLKYQLTYSVVDISTKISILWGNEEKWYDGIVTNYNAAVSKHEITFSKFHKTFL